MDNFKVFVTMTLAAFLGCALHCQLRHDQGFFNDIGETPLMEHMQHPNHH